MFSKYVNSHSKELINLLLEKIPQMKRSKMIDEIIMKEKWPQEFWEVRGHEEFMALARNYHKDSTYWNRYLFILLKYYCIADKDVRRGCL